ncbi:hypothetical protein KIW84_UN0764 [Lathyrus oleraceus]|nr:hypothetical protein KIW84_UN0764 [Pisum sativum]
MPSAEEPALLYATICLRALALWGVVRPAMLDLAVVGAYEWYCNVCVCWLYALHGTGSIPEREPEKRLPHPRKAAARNYPILTREVVTINNNTGLIESVKKLVVGPWLGLIGPPLVCTGWLVPSAGDALLALIGRSCLRRCYFEEIRVLQASLRSLDTLAWDNTTGF